MKKLLTLMLATVFALSLFAGLNVSAATKTFTENFNSSWDWTKWANANNDEGEGNDDPKLDLNDFIISGGQLHMNTLATNNSFLYLMPRLGKTNKFTITWKMKSNVTNDSWIGVSVLKDTNDRFNGCNNMLVFFRMQPGAIAVQFDRGYPGGGGTVTQNSKMVGPGTVSADPKQWQNYKLEYNAGVYKAYVGNELLGTLNYDKLKNPGYISLNSCIADVVIDDFSVSYDTTASSSSASSSAQVSSKASSASSSKTASNPASQASSQAGISSDLTSTASVSTDSSAPAAYTNDDFKAKYEDVAIDYSSNIITLSRKINVSELLESFNMKDGYTVKAYEGSEEIADTAKTVSDTMTLKLFNGDQELNSFTIKTSFSSDDNSTPRQESNGGFPWVIVIILGAVVIIGGAGAAVYFLKLKK
jgi:hypothetical protein